MKGSKGQEYWIILIGGMLLSLNAGHLNGTTMLQDHPTTTTHMTGNCTSLGIAIADLNKEKIFFLSLLILSYVFGSFISGTMIPFQSFSISLGYGRVFLLVSVILTSAALIDIFWTSKFVVYDLLVACAAGMQNGMVSRYSGNILRIGHVTGLCTDIGVNIGRYIMGVRDSIWRIQILLSLLFTFFFGGFIARRLHPIFGKYQLLLSAGVSFLIGVAYIIYLHASQYHFSVFQSIFGIAVPEPGNSDRQSLETNIFTEAKTISSDELCAYDEDYNLTQEEALRLHCNLDGDLIDESAKDELFERLLSMADNSIEENLHQDNEAENRARLTSANIRIVNQLPIPTPPPVLHPLQKRNKKEFSLIMSGSMLLALNAGIINSITANTNRGYFVSHVSGSTTNAGIALAGEHFGRMSIYLALILCFMFGSFLVGMMVPSSVFRLGISYTRVFLFEGLLLLVAASCNLGDSSSLYFYYICSCACGVQNAIVTKYSGGIIRTTHPTGGLTDIGSILGRMVSGHYTDLWQLKVLIPLVLCFITGGVIGTGLHKSFGRDALFFNVAFIFLVSIFYLLYLKYISRTDLTYQQLLFGKYTYPFVKSIGKTLRSMRYKFNGEI